MKSVHVFLIFALLLLGNSECRPNMRSKRLSDNKLSELNTKIGMSRLKGQIVTIPMAHGQFDPKIIGRRRRSQSGLLELLMNPQDDNVQDEMTPEFVVYEDSYKR